MTGGRFRKAVTIAMAAVSIGIALPTAAQTYSDGYKLLKAKLAEGDHALPLLLFLDLKMPGTDGFQVLAWIRCQPRLRRLLCDMVEEYGRHTGHADLIREAVDGRVGEDPPADWTPAWLDPVA